MKQNLDQLIAHWQNKKIITAKQASQMRADIELDTKERNKNRFIMALSIIGAIGLGIGMILFVSSNWEQLPKAVKLIMAIGLPVVPLSIAYWLLMAKQTYIALGRGALLIGLLMIGAAMAIIGQVYHLESEYTRFFSFWTLLIIPFVYLFRRPEAVALVAVLGGGAIGAFLVEQVDQNHRMDELVLTFFPVVYVVYGMILYCVGRVFGENTERWHQAGQLLRTLGTQVTLVALFFMTFEFYAETLSEVGFSIPEEITRLFLNLFYVAFLVYVLYKAIKVEADKVISSVFFWFGVFFLVRYFDFFWDMLPTSLFFMVGGGLFIGGAIFLERQRKKLLAGFDGDSVVKNLKYDE